MYTYNIYTYNIYIYKTYICIYIEFTCMAALSALVVAGTSKTAASMSAVEMGRKLKFCFFRSPNWGPVPIYAP